MTTQENLALFSNHHLYYVIARSNLDQGTKIDQQLQQDAVDEEQINELLTRTHGSPDPDYAPVADYRRIQLLEGKCQHLTQACVFAAMAAEAYINFYPRWRSQPARMLDAVDVMSLESKWFVIPALINGGQTLDPGHQPMQDLKFLVATRNKLVHSRPKVAVSIRDGQFDNPQTVAEDYYGPSLADVERCVGAVRHLVTSLQAIDPPVETEWLGQDRFHSIIILPRRPTTQ